MEKSEVELPVHQIFWHTNKLCNFRCEYCFGRGKWLRGQLPATEHPAVGRYSPQHIARCFDNTGSSWKIILAGGECFLYPQFVEMVQELTDNHYVAVSTNLSTSNVYEFADAIPPERVLAIGAALHITERESRSGGVGEFIKKVLLLQNRGFVIRVDQVGYPPLLPRLEAVVERLVASGIKNCHITPFEGMYRGRQYPGSYTSDERSVIDRYAIGGREVEDFGRTATRGKLCAAGQKDISMTPSGDLYRCHSSQRKYGNLFTSDYRLDESPRPCPVRECICFWGHKPFVTSQQASASATIGEMVMEKTSPLRSPRGCVARSLSGRPSLRRMVVALSRRFA
jgi:MoaA/NifB/PqqE/SkfB family radical SAM enzyme